MSSTVAPIDAIADELAQEFDYLDDWESRYGYIIDLGAKLSTLNPQYQNDETRVHGCVSQVWLYAEYQQGVMNFNGTSDSDIVRGLIALLLKLYQGQKPDAIIHHQPEIFFNQLGLDKHLSASRSNGFYAMIQRINQLSQKYCT